MSQKRKLLNQIEQVCEEICDMKIYSSSMKNHGPPNNYHMNKEHHPDKYEKDGKGCMYTLNGQ